MKNSLTNPVKYKKMIIPEAILLTVLIHALFFALFSVPSVKTERTERENISVTLLRFPDAKDKEILEHLNNYAPTHFSNPHSKLGFSSFHSAAKRNLINIPEIKNPVPQISGQKYALSQTPLPEIKKPLNQLPLFSNDTAAGTINKQEYPFAAATSGIIIGLTFSTDEQRMIKEFPLSNTVFKLIHDKKSNIMPRLILLKSCGRRALDKSCMRLLYQEMPKLAQCANGEIFTVYYSRNNDAGENL